MSICGSTSFLSVGRTNESEILADFGTHSLSSSSPSQKAIRHPQAYRNDMYHFINRPIPRLLRYDLLLKEISKLSKKEGLPTDEIQQVQQELAASAALTDKAVAEAQDKIEMWQLKDTLATPSDAKFDGSVVSSRLVASFSSFVRTKLTRWPSTSCRSPTWSS